MHIGVMSDTHGRIDFMQRAADRMIDEFHVGAIVHLGDDYADVSELDARGVALLAVPGMFERAWKDPSIPHRRIEEFGGVRFFITHAPTHDSHDSPDDPNPDHAKNIYGADVLLHGHTHHYRAVREAGGLIVINPGHLKSVTDRGHPATFAIIDVERPNIKVQIIELNGSLVDKFEFTIS